MTNLQHILNYYNDFPFLIKMAWVISGILLFAIVVLTIVLKVLRTSLRNKDEDKIAYRKTYETSLIEYLYSGTEDGELSEIQKSIIEDLKISVPVKEKRKIIVSTLYNLLNEVSGEMSDSIKILYFETGLYDYAKSKLHSGKWHVIAKGIGELTRFGIDEAYDEVKKFIYHERMEVRKETQLYMVNMFRFKGLSFLNTLEAPLSEWAQVQLLETLQRFDDQQICDIKPWLKSSNNTVVMFALKLAKIYNQFEVKDALMELLSHSKRKIRVYTIDVLTSLYGIEAKEILKTNFKNLSLKEQIGFFGLLEKLVVPDDEPFIEKHLFHENFEIQLLALKILKSINIDKYMGLQAKAKKKSNPDILEFVNKI